MSDKYYLAGPMTGLPEYNFPAFDDACKKLRETGHLEILSPHEIKYDEPNGRGSLPRAVYLEGGIQLLFKCSGIILLPDWWKSPGARLELKIALCLEMEAYTYHVKSELPFLLPVEALDLALL